MTIIIGCDSFLSLRNVRNGNLAQLLPDVHVLVDPGQLEGSKIVCPVGVQIGPLVDFYVYNFRELAPIFQKTYLARKARYDGMTLWNEMVGSSYRNFPERNQSLRRFASVTMAGARFGQGMLDGLMDKAQIGRQACAQALRAHPLAQEYYHLFEQIKPDVVAGFSLEGPREMLLVEAANQMGIPTVVMIRSRDNLSVKIQHLPEAQAYMVWSESTRQFLLRMYPEIQPDKVFVTGSPQFDHHLDKTYYLPRIEFFSKIGLDPNRPLVVYTTTTPGLCDHEIEITQQLADAAHSGQFLNNAQLLVRGHPRMFGSNLQLLHREYPEAHCYPLPAIASLHSPEHEAKVVQLILEDESIHLSTLAYQSVQVNICGTMTIDSAILDKPTVNVYYDLVQGIPSGLSARRFYKRSDAKLMLAYGASRLAHSPEECINLINQYLENPKLDALGRQHAREQDCGPLDGKAGQRIAEIIKQVSKHNTQEPIIQPITQGPKNIL